jgi:hypothetical protein
LTPAVLRLAVALFHSQSGGSICERSSH